MLSALHHVTGLARSVGWLGAGRILARRILKRSKPISVRAWNFPSTLELCPTESDLFVMSQVFGWREYFPGERIVDRLRRIAAGWIAKGVKPVIVDGGANVGYSAIFFSEILPEATVLAVEPEVTTFKRLCRNTVGRGAIKPLHAALWEHGNGVLLKHGKLGSWSHHVGTTGSFVPSVTLSSLLEAESPARLLLLKLDIEGAEREVLASSPDIVGSAMCIMIEPHDFMQPGLACLSPLFQALRDKPFDTLISGERLFLFSPELTISV